jgi:hypothetical protein
VGNGEKKTFFYVLQLDVCRDRYFDDFSSSLVRRRRKKRRKTGRRTRAKSFARHITANALSVLRWYVRNGMVGRKASKENCIVIK